jgi:hypothetical protein
LPPAGEKHIRERSLGAIFPFRRRAQPAFEAKWPGTAHTAKHRSLNHRIASLALSVLRQFSRELAFGLGVTVVFLQPSAR